MSEIEDAVMAERQRCISAIAQCVVGWERTQWPMHPDLPGEMIRRLSFPRWGDPDASDEERGLVPTHPQKEHKA